MTPEPIVQDIVEPIVTTVSRRYSLSWQGSLIVGLGVGAAIGFYAGYRYSKQKLRKEIMDEAEGQINEIRENYRAKLVAKKNDVEKGPVESIIRNREYSVENQPPGVRPPIQYHKPVEVVTPVVQNIFRSDAAAKDPDEDWDFEKESGSRDIREPYIIHINEYTANESGYTQTDYTYYVKDDVLVETSDPRTPLINRDRLVGNALERFGHGSDDYNIVYVRNDRLELEFEIGRVRKSWSEEVLGLSPDEAG